MHVTVDASWASLADCKSTSGGIIQIQGFTLSHWCRTQPIVTQSSCESELLALNTGAVEGKLVISILAEINLHPELVLFSDSASGTAAVERRGLGRMRHINIKELWLQDEIREKRLSIRRVASSVNMADAFTKPLPRPKFQQLLQALGMVMDGPVQMLGLDDDLNQKNFEDPKRTKEKQEGTSTNQDTHNFVNTCFCEHSTVAPVVALTGQMGHGLTSMARGLTPLLAAQRPTAAAVARPSFNQTALNFGGAFEQIGAVLLEGKVYTQVKVCPLSSSGKLTRNLMGRPQICILDAVQVVDGRINFFEYKSSPTAPMTWNQQHLFPLIKEFGCVIMTRHFRGNHVGSDGRFDFPSDCELSYGQTVGPTSVQMIRSQEHFVPGKQEVDVVQQAWNGFLDSTKQQGEVMMIEYLDRPHCKKCKELMFLDANPSGRAQWTCQQCGEVMDWGEHPSSSSSYGFTLVQPPTSSSSSSTAAVGAGSMATQMDVATAYIQTDAAPAISWAQRPVLPRARMQATKQSMPDQSYGVKVCREEKATEKQVKYAKGLLKQQVRTPMEIWEFRLELMNKALISELISSLTD